MARLPWGSDLVRLEGFEPPARGLEGHCSIQLSYRRIFCIVSITPLVAANLVLPVDTLPHAAELPLISIMSSAPRLAMGRLNILALPVPL